jgi:hypothetical protein
LTCGGNSGEIRPPPKGCALDMEDEEFFRHVERGKKIADILDFN